MSNLCKEAESVGIVNKLQSDQTACKQGAEAKLGIFKYNNKQLYYKTRLILISKNKHQNKMLGTKQ